MTDNDQIKELRDRIQENIISGTDCKAKLFTISEVRALLDHISQLESANDTYLTALHGARQELETHMHRDIGNDRVLDAITEIDLAIAKSSQQDKGKEE